MNDYQLTTVILCSVRYALSRSTSIAYDVCEIIKQTKNIIHPWAIAKIAKEIEDTIKRKEIEHQYLIDIWEDLLLDLSNTGWELPKDNDPLIKAVEDFLSGFSKNKEES